MLNNNKISGIYILTNPVIYKWPNRFVYTEADLEGGVRGVRPPPKIRKAYIIQR